MESTRRGFLKAFAAIAAGAALPSIPLALQAQAEPIISALMKAKADSGFLFLLRKEDWKGLWDELATDMRFAVDSGYTNILCRGVPVVWCDNADKMLGPKRFALITEQRFLKEIDVPLT